MQSKRGVETEAAGAGRILTAVPSELSRVVGAGCGRGVGQPKDRPLFYSESVPIIAPVTSKFTVLPRRQLLTTVKFSKGSAHHLLESASAWAVRGSSEAHSSPLEELVVSLAHLEDRTALTDEGLLLGKMAFGSLVHVWPG
jgi:hypothetical protein